MATYYKTQELALKQIKRILQQLKTLDEDFRPDSLVLEVFEMYPCSTRFIKTCIEEEAARLGGKPYRDEIIWTKPTKDDTPAPSAP